MGESDPQGLLDEAERFLQAGDYAAAEHAFRRVVDLVPDSAVARSKLGVTLVHKGRLDEAIAEFSRAVSLQPTYAPAYSNLGNAYRERGQLTDALAAYERALAIDPDYWLAHQNLGILYKQMGRVGDAVEHFKKATRLSMRQTTRSAHAPRLGCLPAAALLIGLLVLAGVWGALRL